MASSVHTSLNVSDLSRSTDFYRRLFGEPAKVRADDAKFVLSNPEIHLALQPGRIDGSGALSHLGIRVESPAAVAQWKSSLEARGLAAGEQRRKACCYALQEKSRVADPENKSTRDSRSFSSAPAIPPAATCGILPEAARLHRFEVRSEPVSARVSSARPVGQPGGRCSRTGLSEAFRRTVRWRDAPPLRPAAGRGFPGCGRSEGSLGRSDSGHGRARVRPSPRSTPASRPSLTSSPAPKQDGSGRWRNS